MSVYYTGLLFWGLCGVICTSLMCSVDLLLGGFLCKESCRFHYLICLKKHDLTSCGSVVMRFRVRVTFLDLENYNPIDISIHGHSLCSKTQSTVFIYLIIIQWQLGNNDESHDVLLIDWLIDLHIWLFLYLFIHAFKCAHLYTFSYRCFYF